MEPTFPDTPMCTIEGSIFPCSAEVNGIRCTSFGLAFARRPLPPFKWCWQVGVSFSEGSPFFSGFKGNTQGTPPFCAFCGFESLKGRTTHPSELYLIFRGRRAGLGIEGYLHRGIGLWDGQFQKSRPWGHSVAQLGVRSFGSCQF